MRVALASGVESITIHALVPSVMLCYDCHDGMASSHGQMMPIEQGDTIEVRAVHLHVDVLPSTWMCCDLIEWRKRLYEHVRKCCCQKCRSPSSAGRMAMVVLLFALFHGMGRREMMMPPPPISSGLFAFSPGHHVK